MEFAHIYFIIGLLLFLPALIIFWIIMDRRRPSNIRRIGEASLIESSSFIVPPWFIIAKRIIFILGISMLFIALMGPRKLEKTIKQKNLSLDLVIALDCSKSMLAKDFQPDRLSRAKMEISSLLDSLKGDRVALVVFAGDAFLQCPLTIDYGAVKLFLDSVDTDFIPTPGTDIARAISVSESAFPEDSEYKVILLITDGETDDKPSAIRMAENAAQRHIKIYTIGIGSQEGEPIPMPDGGYKRGPDGEIVLTRLDEALLKQIAKITSGRYFNAMSQFIGVKAVFDTIANEKRRFVESGFLPKYKYLYHIPLLFGFIFLSVAWFFPFERWPK